MRSSNLGCNEREDATRVFIATVGVSSLFGNSRKRWANRRERPGAPSGDGPSWAWTSAGVRTRQNGGKDQGVKGRGRGAAAGKVVLGKRMERY